MKDHEKDQQHSPWAKRCGHIVFASYVWEGGGCAVIVDLATLKMETEDSSNGARNTRLCIMRGCQCALGSMQLVVSLADAKEEEEEEEAQPTSSFVQTKSSPLRRRTCVASPTRLRDVGVCVETARLCVLL